MTNDLIDPSEEVAEAIANAMCEAADYPIAADELARVSLRAVSIWLALRAIKYDREADEKRCHTMKMQGAALASAANDLSGNVRRDAVE